MILEPTDQELTWGEVEANFQGLPRMAEAEWKAAGIVMPDGASDALMLDMLEKFLAATAIALGVPLKDVYPQRHRIRWLCFTDTPGRWLTFASLDGGPPMVLREG